MYTCRQALLIDAVAIHASMNSLERWRLATSEKKVEIKIIFNVRKREILQYTSKKFITRYVSCFFFLFFVLTVLRFCLLVSFARMLQEANMEIMFLRFHCRFDDHIEVFPRKCVEVCRIVSLGTTGEFLWKIVMKMHNVWDFLASCVTISFSWRKLCRGVVWLVFVSS